MISYWSTAELSEIDKFDNCALVFGELGYRRITRFWQRVKTLGPDTKPGFFFEGEAGPYIQFTFQLTGKTEFLVKSLNLQGGGVQTSWTPLASSLTSTLGFLGGRVVEKQRASEHRRISCVVAPPWESVHGFGSHIIAFEFQTTSKHSLCYSTPVWMLLMYIRVYCLRPTRVVIRVKQPGDCPHTKYTKYTSSPQRRRPTR